MLHAPTAVQQPINQSTSTSMFPAQLGCLDRSNMSSNISKITNQSTTLHCPIDPIAMAAVLARLPLGCEFSKDGIGHAGDGEVAASGRSHWQGWSVWECLPHQAAHVSDHCRRRLPHPGLRPCAVRAVAVSYSPSFLFVALEAGFQEKLKGIDVLRNIGQIVYPCRRQSGRSTCSQLLVQ